MLENILKHPEFLGGIFVGIIVGYIFARISMKKTIEIKDVPKNIQPAQQPKSPSDKPSNEKSPSLPETTRVDESKCLSGKAFVTDGDGIRVQGQEVRLDGLDAPEWDQKAKHKDGYWFNHGKSVKSALINKIGGKYVQVRIERYDKFQRAVGVVTYQGEDIGEWLVREGHAIACYGNQYKEVEREAKATKRGMWDHAVNIDPRDWRHRDKEQEKLE